MRYFTYVVAKFVQAFGIGIMFTALWVGCVKGYFGLEMKLALVSVLVFGVGYLLEWASSR